MSPGEPRVVFVSDTVDDVNGVAFGLRRLVAAANQRGYVAHLIGAKPRTRAVIAGDCVVHVPALFSVELPWYRGMKWSVPRPGSLDGWLAANADLVQIATPGPMGFFAMRAARRLGLPFVAQYHTEVPQYAARQTGIASTRHLVRPVVGRLYRRAELCLVPSEAARASLRKLGVAEDRIVRVDRGVDLERFHPRHADRAALQQKYGIPADAPLVLYVGRLSKEKNLGRLAEAWRRIHAAEPTAYLLVVGEGPRPDLLKGPGVVLIGPRFDAELARLFASADVFAFPSETETYGNVIAEAAASAIPAVVSNRGAASELVRDGETGYVVDTSDPAPMADAVVRLLADRAQRRQFGHAARVHIATRGMDAAVETTWDIYRSFLFRRTLLAEVA